MIKKLTLTIDQSVIVKAKKLAQEKNKSISRIVEEYLRNVSSGSNTVEYAKPIESPITDSLVNMFTDTGKDCKALLEEALMEKHL
ncbi:MAG: hypothetical protein ISR78_06290 [Spirochaetia bacterium]|nr:hypothetical protein [Spirochaetia bacterium]